MKQTFGELYGGNNPTHGVYTANNVQAWGERAAAISHHWSREDADAAAKREAALRGEPCVVVEYAATKYLYIVKQVHATGTSWHYLAAPGFHTQWVHDISVAARFESKAEAETIARTFTQQEAGYDEYVVEPLWTDKFANH